MVHVTPTRAFSCPHYITSLVKSAHFGETNNETALLRFAASNNGGKKTKRSPYTIAHNA
jgi:hypothetical protein